MLPRRAPASGRVQVGRYVLTGRIGRGGMGMVYRGVDLGLEREVAIKTLISEGGLESESRKRFAVEAKAAARLQHPNIVIVYELGEDRGVPFIAMELLSGGDLEGVLRGGEPIGVAEKIDVVAQVCRGLAYAHERGIVHRDIKPSNVRLLDDGTAKIMDFGIAKLGATQLTKAGMMVGTVHYMSPEQVRGRTLDGRSDVFSVGVILYELLGGERPFRGEGTTETLYKIVHEEPTPLDLSSLGRAGETLAAVVARALAKDPAERYTAAELARALGDTLAQLADAEPPALPETAGALAEARGLLREGRLDEGERAARAVAERYPGLAEAQRLLRTALRRRKERLEPSAPEEDEFPELEATFEATRTRQEPATAGVPPTVALGPLEAGLQAGATAVVGLGARVWIGTAAALVALALAAAGVLWHGGRAASGPVRSEPVDAAALVNGRDSGVVTNGAVETGAALPDVRSLAIRTTPPGALVTLDGEPVGPSPLEVVIDPAREHTLGVSLEGHDPWEKRIARGERLRPLDIALERLPAPGIVAITSAYPVDVVHRGRTLARGEKAPRVSVPGGRQVLTLVAPTVFLRADYTVEVPSGGETTLATPPTGRLNVRAMPDNCQVLVDGVFLDYPPVLDRPIAAGRHVVGFRWPDGSQEQKVAEIEGGAPAFVTGHKPKE